MIDTASSLQVGGSFTLLEIHQNGPRFCRKGDDAHRGRSTGGVNPDVVRVVMHSHMYAIASDNIATSRLTLRHYRDDLCECNPVIIILSSSKDDKGYSVKSIMWT